MDYLDLVRQGWHFLSSQDWARNLGLLVAVSVFAYLPGWLCSRALRGREEMPYFARSRFLHAALEVLRASFWPLWALLLLYLGFKVWVYLAPEIAGRPFEVFPLLWFFLLFRILTALIKELLPPGTRRTRIRLGVIPLFFVLAGLQQLGVLEPILGWLQHPLLNVGQVGISLISILLAAAIFAVFIFAARLIARFLRSRLLPGIGVDTNVGESLATLARYGLIIIGLLVAVESLGFDLTTLKIAFGALGIGIGFGLQNVVNNVVSGFILLIEGTVKRGDIIVVGGTDGRVIRIGLRSSVVRTRSGHEIIVPNADLVAAPVTNFSFNDKLVRVEIAVGVSYGADPNRVRELLLEAAQGEKAVLDQPQPDVVFKGYGNNSIDFELRVWINDPWRIPQVRSALYFSIWYKLKGAKIEIPFPQRDLHVRDEAIKVRIYSPEEETRLPQAREDRQEGKTGREDS